MSPFRTLHLKQGAAPETDKNFNVPVPNFEPFLNRYSQHPEILSILILLQYMTKLQKQIFIYLENVLIQIYLKGNPRCLRDTNVNLSPALIRP